MGTFNEMLNWLRDGKKARRAYWNENDYIYLSGEDIINRRLDRVKFHNIKTMDADDWQIFKEEQEKMICCVCGREDYTFSAHCSICGRVPHRLMTGKEYKNFLKSLKSFRYTNGIKNYM